MANENLSLYVASYADAAAAEADFRALKDAEKAQDFAVLGAVVASRDDAGEVTVDEHGAASPVGGGTVLGAPGVVIPPLIASIFRNEESPMSPTPVRHRPERLRSPRLSRDPDLGSRSDPLSIRGRIDR